MTLKTYTRCALLAVITGLGLAAISVKGNASVSKLAVTVQPGMTSASNGSWTLSSYGTVIIGTIIISVLFLAFLRGLEIRRQHPRSFN